MNEKTVLVIDDSATIRRLCDNELSSAGYRVIMAPTAEEGVTTAQEMNPDLIILDHQLPGTTGYEVCCDLLANDSTKTIPVVASSTLRKKAYAEYIDCDNVVDMLPKPYTPEALIATVENAINTAAMVVQSQSEGSAVPEVINQQGESALSGAFGCFGLREILDLLNNGCKSGMLEVEAERSRVFIFTDNGRIQAVTASGIDPEIVASQMPDSLSELGPVIKLTVISRKGSEVDGLVELLNNNVLDPRLLKKLLRTQAAILLRHCFTQSLKNFRFEPNEPAPSLFQKLPLDCSLLSFLVDGALSCDEDKLPPVSPGMGYVRKSVRGQNLDRAGLSSRHMRLMSTVSEPVTVSQVANSLGWSKEEAQRVLHGFELAELVEQTTVESKPKVIGLTVDAEWTGKIRSVFQSCQNEIAGKLVRDLLGLKLAIRRTCPDVLIFEVGDKLEDWQSFLQESTNHLNGTRLIALRCDSENLDLPESVEQISNTSDEQHIRELLLEEENVLEDSVDSADEAANVAPEIKLITAALQITNPTPSSNDFGGVQ